MKNLWCHIGENPLKEPVKTVRKGAIRMRDIPPAILKSLNQGKEDSITLVEWLAVDAEKLISSVAPRVGLKKEAPRLKAYAKSIRQEGITVRMKEMGRILFEITKERKDRKDIFKNLASTPSDIVRSWAALMVTADRRLNLKDRLIAARWFASDRSVGVKECAWDSYRDYLPGNIRQSIQLLIPWAKDADPNIRRCAVESLRPRGVWCKHIEVLKEKPEIGLPLIEYCAADTSKYVQRSVANWLNDASKSKPRWVEKIGRSWKKKYRTKETDWIVNHALRTVRKKGNQHL